MTYAEFSAAAMWGGSTLNARIAANAGGSSKQRGRTTGVGNVIFAAVKPCRSPRLRNGDIKLQACAKTKVNCGYETKLGGQGTFLSAGTGSWNQRKFNGAAVLRDVPSTEIVMVAIRA